MTQKLAVTAAVGILIASLAGSGWAAGGKGKKPDQKNEVPDAINRQFQWEEKVVGPKDKGVDHRKIEAMQEKARREEAARQNEPPPKKAGRAEGVAAPASATLPTMDIEKAAPAPASRKPAAKKASYAEQERARPRDAIDNLLAEESEPKSASGGSGRAGLRNVFATGDDKTNARPSHAAKKRKKHHH